MAQSSVSSSLVVLLLLATGFLAGCTTLQDPPETIPTSWTYAGSDGVLIQASLSTAPSSITSLPWFRAAHAMIAYDISVPGLDQGSFRVAELLDANFHIQGHLVECPVTLGRTNISCADDRGQILLTAKGRPAFAGMVSDPTGAGCADKPATRTLGFLTLQSADDCQLPTRFIAGSMIHSARQTEYELVAVGPPSPYSWTTGSNNLEPSSAGQSLIDATRTLRVGASRADAEARSQSAAYAEAAARGIVSYFEHQVGHSAGPAGLYASDVVRVVIEAGDALKSVRIDMTFSFNDSAIIADEVAINDEETVTAGGVGRIDQAADLSVAAQAWRDLAGAAPMGWQVTSARRVPNTWTPITKGVATTHDTVLHALDSRGDPEMFMVPLTAGWGGSAQAPLWLDVRGDLMPIWPAAPG